MSRMDNDQKNVYKVLKQKENRCKNFFKKLVENNISKHTFLLYQQKYQNIIKHEINNLVGFEQNETKNSNRTNIYVALGINNKNNIVSLVQQQNDNDIHEVIGRGLYELFVGVIINYLLQIITQPQNIKTLNNLIINNIFKNTNTINLEIKNIKSLISNSFLINIINVNLFNLINGHKDLVLLDINQRLKNKIKKVELNLSKEISQISHIIYENIVFLFKNNNITFNIFFEDFDIILNSLESNYQRELSTFNTFQIFNKYLSDINNEIFDFNNFYLINNDVFISKNSLLKLDDDINFNILETDFQNNDLELFIINNIINIVNIQKKYIQENYKTNKKIKELDNTIDRNIEKIIEYIIFLYNNVNKNIIGILINYFKKDIDNINKRVNIWDIDNFIELSNEIFGLHKIRIKINKKNYYINKIIDKNFKIFKEKYFLNEKVKGKINLILKNIYKKIYIKEIYSYNYGTVSNILLLGPTGSGKSYFAKALSEELGTPLVKIDANFLKSDHSFTNIVGSPPSYIGFDSLNDWQQKVKGINDKGLNGVLLIDEVEKADPNILDLFLGLLDEGEIILNNGVRLDLTKFVVIFTSNLIQKENIGIGFRIDLNNEKEGEKYNNNMKKKLLEFFKPEFLGRLDHIELIPAYTKDDLSKIFNFLIRHILIRYEINGALYKKIEKELNNEKENIIQKVLYTEENIRFLSKEIEKIILENINIL